MISTSHKPTSSVFDLRRPQQVTEANPGYIIFEMFAEIKFMDGLDPTNIKERELATAEKKSHSARMAHKRRRERRDALLQLHATGTSPTIYQSSHAFPSATDSGRTDRGQSAPLALTLFEESRTTSTPSEHEEIRNGTMTRGISKVLVPTKGFQAAYIPRQPHSDAYLAFDHGRWTSMFQFYFDVCGPTIIRCHTRRAGEAYMKVIPQLAMSSGAVRHMLLAYACLQAHSFKNAQQQVQNSDVLCLHHYSKSLGTMRTKPSGIDTLAAALLGYIFEVTRNNLHSAIMHLKGFRAIVNTFAGSKDENFQYLTMDHRFVDKVLSNVHPNEARTEENGEILSVGTAERQTTGHSDVRRSGSWHVYHPPSRQISAAAHKGVLNCARSSLESIVAEVGNNFPLKDAATVNELDVCLYIWLENLITLESQQSHAIEKGGLLWLFVLATALLPSDCTRHLSRLTQSVLHSYITGDEDHEMTVDAADMLFVTQMMKSAAGHSTRFLQLPECRRRLKSSFDLVEKSMSYRRPCRTWVAVKHVYYHVMCDDDSRTVHDMKDFLSRTH